MLCPCRITREIFLFLSLSLIDSIVSLCLSSLSERLHSSTHRGSLRQHQRSNAAAEQRSGRGLQGEGRHSPSKMAHTHTHTHTCMRVCVCVCVCVQESSTDSCYATAVLVALLQDTYTCCLCAT